MILAGSSSNKRGAPPLGRKLRKLAAVPVVVSGEVEPSLAIMMFREDGKEWRIYDCYKDNTAGGNTQQVLHRYTGSHIGYTSKSSYVCSFGSATMFYWGHRQLI